MIRSNDPLTVTIPLTGEGVNFISLSSPLDQAQIDLCSASVFRFEWKTDIPFSSYEIQFSPDPTFDVISAKFKVAGSSAYILPPLQRKRVLLIPGPNGGIIYWRVMGTKSDGSQNASNQQSIIVAAPQPVGSPVISPVGVGTLPVLTWENDCNTRFKVSFGSDPFFSKVITQSYNVSSP